MLGKIVVGVLASVGSEFIWNRLVPATLRGIKKKIKEKQKDMEKDSV